MTEHNEIDDEPNDEDLAYAVARSSQRRAAESVVARLMADRARLMAEPAKTLPGATGIYIPLRSPMSNEARIVWHLLRDGGYKASDSGWRMAGKRRRRERRYYKDVWDGMSDASLEASGASITFTHYRAAR